MANFGLRGLCQSDVTCAQSSSTSIELKGFPLYASMNSAASDGFENLMTTIDLFGAVSLPRSIVSMALPHILSTAYLIILRCDIPSPAGATKVKKSEGVIHAGTAKIASVTPPSASRVTFPDEAWGSASISSVVRAFAASRKICTTPSGRLVEPSFVRLFGTKEAEAGPTYLSAVNHSDNLPQTFVFLSRLP